MLALYALLLAETPGVNSPVEFDCERVQIIDRPSENCSDIFGRSVEASVGPTVSGFPTVKITHQPAWGTGFSTEAVTLLQPEGRSYRHLWFHILVRGEQRPDASGTMEEWEEASYEWSLDPAGKRITVTGSRTISSVDSGQPVGQPEVLPSEAYCYSAQTRRFEKC